MEGEWSDQGRLDLFGAKAKIDYLVLDTKLLLLLINMYYIEFFFFFFYKFYRQKKFDKIFHNC